MKSRVFFEALPNSLTIFTIQWLLMLFGFEAHLVQRDQVIRVLAECIFSGAQMITDNEHKDTWNIYNQSSIIHMYCTMESLYLVLQGRRQLL